MKTLQVVSRDEWRSWLEENHRKEKEIWLVYHKKHTCEPRIPYDDAVEEALCFGWIDSIIKRIDENTYCQRYTPRRKGSRWSEINIRRAEKMIENGRMTGPGHEAYLETKNNPSLIIRKEEPHTLIELPGDLNSELHKRKGAFRTFIAFPKSYRRMCINWINAAKKPETRSRRIAEVAAHAARGRKIGLK